MEMTKYNKEDCIPIAYLVLSLTSDAYLCNAFKILVHLDYPDLKGIVATDSLDSSSWELLMGVKSGPLVSVGDSITRLLQANLSLILSYRIDTQALLLDERLKSEARDFYVHVMLDYFPADNSKEETTYPEYMSHLQMFALSTIAITSILCEVLANEEIDLQDVWRDEPVFHEFLSKDYRDHENYTAIGMFQHLGMMLFMNFENIKF